MTPPRDVEVELEEIDAEHGGRQSQLWNDSRPQFFYLGHDWDCRVEIISRQTPESRVGVRAYLSFISPDEHELRLRVGSPFLLREGHKTIAFGIVTAIVDLLESARRARDKAGTVVGHLSKRDDR